MDHLIGELEKIRDVKKRRLYLEKQDLDEAEIEQLLEKVHLRLKGKLKFPRAPLMRFDREGLAQASSKYLAEYRTWKMRDKLGKITCSLDVCCGIGGDTIAQATRWNVVAVEKDEKILEMARHNVCVYNLDARVEFILGDITALVDTSDFQDIVKDVNCIFFDPGRRSKGRRTVNIDEYVPPLSFVEKLLTISPNICVKISPGTDLQTINYDCDLEVVSYKGEVKEVMLWFGGFKNQPDKREIMATKLPEKISVIRGHTSKNDTLSEPLKFLYEPDPAFIKAHMIEDLAAEFGLHLLNRKIAYLTGNKLVNSPLLKRYRIIRILGVDYEQISIELSQLGIGNVDFKARGINVDLRTIHKKVRGRGKKRGIVVFTKVAGQNQAIICAYNG